jgi:dTDP-4-dehydrorhamnose 3,5-epimerase
LIFEETELAGAYRVRLERHGDERGFFARAFCREEFRDHGLEADVAQANLSVNRRRGTVRGLHFQLPPAAEVKMVRCVRGAVHDVILDLRPESPTFGDSLGVELDDENREMLYVPKGFAHGFQTLTDDAEVFYLVTAAYAPERERGVRYDDPRFEIEWPLEVSEISEKDRTWDDYTPEPALEGLYGDAPARRTS